MTNRTLQLLIAPFLLISSGILWGETKVAVPQEKDMRAYLLVYFKDQTHGLYMALSVDGYSFTDVNNAEPVMDGKDLAEQKGIRDPHIARGPDGTFYLAMTDLHIYAKEAGLRSSDWQRDAREYGWGNNRGLVLMKSKDLIHWSHTIVRLDKAFPGLEEIGCAWAPETTYDATAKKLMIYFTMRFKNGPGKLYWSFVNDEFTKLETRPKLLFGYPTAKSSIDGDVTKVGDKYHLFYVTDADGQGIKQAISDSLTYGYESGPRFIGEEPKSHEAPNLWRRIGTDKWVLMYDVYGMTPSNFGFIETSDFVHFTELGYFNDGVMKATNFVSPKHGAVIHLTAGEAQRLADHWKLKMKF